MQRFPGKHPNTFVYYHGGYSYHRERRPEASIYRCSKKSSDNCRGKAQIVNERVIIKEAHNMHAPDLRLLDELQFKQEVLRRCRETLDPFDDIFREVSVLYPEGAVAITYLSIRSSMARARRGSRPPVPETLSEMSRVLREYQPMRSFYRGCARSSDNYAALIFATNDMIQRLNVATEIFLDATFSVVPNRPRACQLLVMYVRHMGVAFPVAFALCERRTAAVYEAVFRFLVNLAPGLPYRLQFIVSDYERAIIAAVRRIFPEARLKGCWFHFCQALSKKWRSLMPRRAPKDLLWMLMGIPLLLRGHQDEALVVIANVADGLAGEYPAILQMLYYYRRQWVPLSDVITVGRAPIRTNNVCESFNRYICGRLGGRHPNIWIFIHKLRILMVSQNIDWARVERGERIRRGRRRRQLNDDLRLTRYQDDLEAGRIGVEEFLRIAVLPRQRRELEAADFMEQAQENDPNPVELPVRDDFPPRNDNEDEELPLDAAAMPDRQQIAPRVLPRIRGEDEIDPGNIRREHIVQVNGESDNDDEYRQHILVHPPTPPLPPELNDEAVSINNDYEGYQIFMVISSDDENNDAAEIVPAPGPAEILWLAPTAEIPVAPGLVVENELAPRPAPMGDNRIVAAAPNLQPLDIEANVQVAVPEVEVAPDVPEPAMEIAAAVVPAMGEAHEREPAQAEAPLAARPAPGLGSSDEKEEVLQRNRCSICLRHRPRIMFMPCNHLVTCERCSEVHLQYRHTCPLCREPIEHIIRVYSG